jgi:hypothetical protein
MGVLSSGHIVDAMFWSPGRYIITASTSPVISLYDIDYLKLRQVSIVLALGHMNYIRTCSFLSYFLLSSKFLVMGLKWR